MGGPFLSLSHPGPVGFFSNTALLSLSAVLCFILMGSIIWFRSCGCVAVVTVSLHASPARARRSFPSLSRISHPVRPHSNATQERERERESNRANRREVRRKKIEQENSSAAGGRVWTDRLGRVTRKYVDVTAYTRTNATALYGQRYSC